MNDIFFILTRGALRRSGNTIVFTDYTVDYKIPINAIKHIVILEQVNLTYEIIKLLLRKEISIHFWRNNQYLGSLFPKKYILMERGTYLIAQVKKYLNKKERMNIAKEFVSSLKDNLTYITKNKEIEKQEINSSSVHHLLKSEAQLWNEFYKFLREHFPNIPMNSRTRRPPKDIGNALISFVNTLVYSIVLCECILSGLSPSISYLHAPKERERASLVFDVSEIYKPLFIYRTFKNFQNKEISGKEIGNGIWLDSHVKREITQLFLNILNETYYDKKLKRDMSIRQMIRNEFQKLKKYLVDGSTYKGTRYHVYNIGL